MGGDNVVLINPKIAGRGATGTRIFNQSNNLMVINPVIKNLGSRHPGIYHNNRPYRNLQVSGELIENCHTAVNLSDTYAAVISGTTNRCYQNLLSIGSSGVRTDDATVNCCIVNFDPH